MSVTKFPANDFLLGTEKSLRDMITPEMYMYLVTVVIAEAVQHIIKPEFCLLCGDPLHERAEGMILAKDECWFTRYEHKKSGQYYCKNSAGILLDNDTKFTSNGISDITKPWGGVNLTVPQDTTELPFNIFGNEKNILTASTDANKSLTLRIDTPGYSRDDIKIVLSKTSFKDYQIHVFMDNKLKGSKELSFNLAAELYSLEDYGSLAFISNGLLTMTIQRRSLFGTKSIHIKELTPNVGFPIK